MFDVSSVDLNLVNVGLFGLKIHFLWLSVTDESNNRTVLDNSVLLFLREILVSLKILLVVAEGSHLRVVPVLVVDARLALVRRIPGDDRLPHLRRDVLGIVQRHGDDCPVGAVILHIPFHDV